MEFNFNHLNEMNFYGAMNKWNADDATVFDYGFYNRYYLGCVVIGQIKVEIAVVKDMNKRGYFISKFSKADARNDRLGFGDVETIRLYSFEDDGINIFGKDIEDFGKMYYHQFKELFCKFFEDALEKAEKIRIEENEIFPFEKSNNVSFVNLAEDTEYNWFGD